MDVVMKNIEKIRGTVIVDSVPDKGTTISIKIPLTLAIIDGMTIKVGESRYTVPITSVKESFKVKENDIIRDTDGNEMILIRGECCPVVKLHSLYNVKNAVAKMKGEEPSEKATSENASNKSENGRRTRSRKETSNEPEKTTDDQNMSSESGSDVVKEADSFQSNTDKNSGTVSNNDTTETGRSADDTASDKAEGSNQDAPKEAPKTTRTRKKRGE
jgi:hypothetical protein